MRGLRSLVRRVERRNWADHLRAHAKTPTLGHPLPKFAGPRQPLVRCSQCHHENGTGATECARCGTSFDPATTTTAVGFRSPLANEAEPETQPPESRPARTPHGIHFLAEEGVFDPGTLAQLSPDEASSVETYDGLKLEQTVLLPGQSPAAPQPADQGADSPSAPSFGLNPALAPPGSAGGTAQPVGVRTMVGVSSKFDNGEATMVGLSAISGDERTPAQEVLGDLGDTSVDNMFDHVASSPADAAAPPSTPETPGFHDTLAIPETLPNLVRPERSSSAPGFGIVRKKRSKRATSTHQNRVAVSAGSYENQRVAPERPNVTTGRTVPVPDPNADSKPVARLAAPTRAEADPAPSVGEARTAAIDVLDGIPAPPVTADLTDPSQLVFGDTLMLDVDDLDVGGSAPQVVPAGRPRDGLSPLSVEAAPKTDSLQPLPVAFGGLPRPAVQPLGVGTAVVSENAGGPPSDVNITAGLSLDAMTATELVGAGAQVETPGPIDALPVDETIAFSPSMDLSNFESPGGAPPSGRDELQLADEAIRAFMGGESLSGTTPLGTAPPVEAAPASAALPAPSRPTASAAASGDLFAVAESAGLAAPAGRSELSGASGTGFPRHLTDASRTSPQARRQIVLLGVIVVLLGALSFLGYLLYQEFTTGGATADGAEQAVTEEEATAE